LKDPKYHATVQEFYNDAIGRLNKALRLWCLPSPRRGASQVRRIWRGARRFNPASSRDSTGTPTLRLRRVSSRVLAGQVEALEKLPRVEQVGSDCRSGCVILHRVGLWPPCDSNVRKPVRGIHFPRCYHRQSSQRPRRAQRPDVAIFLKATFQGRLNNAAVLHFILKEYHCHVNLICV
jgi:hypothetical protein